MIRCPLRNQRSHSSRSSDVGKLLSNPPIALKVSAASARLLEARNCASPGSAPLKWR